MHKQQRGGTLLGLILGVMIGLGAALAVAVYVTKVPVPFVNKTTPHKPDQDAAEAIKNKDWDPNTTLQGKAAARTPASAAPAPVAAAPAIAASLARPAPNSARVTAAASSAPVPLAARADPLGDLAKARTGATPAPATTAAAPARATATADPFAYFVQAGAFRTQEDAESLRARLTLLGVEAKVSERDQAGRVVYRVRVGPFDQKDAADRMKEKLDGNGFDAALVRVQR